MSGTEECGTRKPIDIGFILDESGSVKPSDWLKMKDFTKIIAEAVKINGSLESEGARASVVTFSDSSILRIKFNAHEFYDSFASGVDLLSQRGGGTNIIDALNRGLDEMFVTSNGMRKDNEKTAIIITDGKDSNDISMYKEVAAKYQDRNIKLLVVGVGAIDREKLKALVGDQMDFFVAENFDQLQKTLVKEIAKDVQGVCQGKSIFIDLYISICM